MGDWLLIKIFFFAYTFTCSEACQDVSSPTSCQAWKDQGICDNPTVKPYCKKTCGFCGTGTLPPPIPSSPPTGPLVTSSAPTRPPVPSSAPKCGKSSVPQSRIVNGVDAQLGAWPWIASLQRNGRHFCGATLIKPNLVLTASHCVEKVQPLSAWTVKLGAHNHNRPDGYLQDIPIKRITMHPSYSRTTLKADLAMIELTRPARLTSRVILACLPELNKYPSIGKQCYLAGWGSIRHPGGTHHTLQQTRLPVVPSESCKHNPEVVCVGNGFKNQPNGKQQPNACRGDSGGPLVCQQSNGSWQLEGVASFVYTYCKYYTGYAPVNKYLPWIKSFMN